MRVVRDIFSEHFERAIVDDEQQYHRLVSFFTRTAPELVERVELWEETEPLFEAYGVDKAIDGVLSRRVDLPSGGYLIIDYAEALTVIDVNSGSFIGRGKGAALEDTITKTNLEAAEEVVNQLRLRDIGGIIVIDFIDMARARNRDAVMKTLRKTLDEDRTKTFTAEISKLGLVEMTRQNVTEGVREIMSRPCPTCDGEGVIRSRGDDRDRVRAPSARRRRSNTPTPRRSSCRSTRASPPSSPATARACCTRSRRRPASRSCSRAPKGSRSITSRSPSQGTREEVEERALPFRQGDEVLVEIVEPHMYDVDDAVAKIDGYIISIAGAAPARGREADGAHRPGRAHRRQRAAAGRVRRGRDARRHARPRRAARRPRKRTPPKRPRATPRRQRSQARRGRRARVRRERVRARRRPSRRDARRGTPSPEDAQEHARPGEPAEGGEDGLQSKPRRRGRRGGRRRSAAKAKADGSE